MAKMWSLWAYGWLQGPWRYVARLPATVTSLSWAHTVVEQPVKKFQSQGLSFSFIIQAPKFFSDVQPKKIFFKVTHATSFRVVSDQNKSSWLWWSWRLKSKSSNPGSTIYQVTRVTNITKTTCQIWSSMRTITAGWWSQQCYQWFKQT